MKKYRSEICEVLHEDFLADFRKGRITEAELREFEEDAFIEVANEIDDTNEVTGELISLSQSINEK